MAQEKFSQTMSLPSYQANPISDKSGMISNDLSNIAGAVGLFAEGIIEIAKVGTASAVEADIQKNIDDTSDFIRTFI